jgi:hypothetical protein
LLLVTASPVEPAVSNVPPGLCNVIELVLKIPDQVKLLVPAAGTASKLKVPEPAFSKRV